MNTEREMAAFRAALRKARLAVTRQRLAIAETAFSTHAHFTADELLDLVRARGVNVGRVTVYRTLKVLVDAGLIEERPFRRDRLLYEHVVGHAHHDHMVCLKCQRIIEFESPVIEREQRRVAKRHGFEVVHHTHTLFGTCRPCAAR